MQLIWKGTIGHQRRALVGLALLCVGCVFLAAARVVPAPEVAAPTIPSHTTFVLHSTMLDEDRVINVYLPPGYDKRDGIRYPMLYMPDGGMQEDFPHVAADVDAAIRDGGMRPMIVVGIENTQRRRDLTGPTRVASDRAIAPRVGGSEVFRLFLSRELMPTVRKRYRSNGRAAIMGESLAGLFVLETFLQQPDLFDTYVVFSPSLWWNQHALVNAASHLLRVHPHVHKTLFITTASDDGTEDAAASLGASLRADAPPALKWTLDRRGDLQHSDIYAKASPMVLRNLFPARGCDIPCRAAH